MTTALATASIDLSLAARRALAPVKPLPADQHPAMVYVAGLAQGSRRTMKSALEKVAGLLTSGRCTAITLPWQNLRFQHTSAIRAAVSDMFSVGYARKILCAVRGVLKAAWRLQLIETEDYRRAIDLAPIKGETLPKGRALSGGEIRALFQACAEHNGIAGARDAALLAVLYGTGLRRSECVALDLSDYNASNGELRIRSGKGNKQRLVYLSDGGTEALGTWLDFRGNDPGPLFVALTPGHRLTARRLDSQAIRDILLKRARQAGTPAAAPHDMRRTFISDLLDAGADSITVQKLAGHANVATTARYDRRGEETKRKASQLIHIPFVKIRSKNSKGVK